MGASSSVNADKLFPERSSAASVEHWLGADDVRNLGQAKAEISRIRHLASDHLNTIEGKPAAAGSKVGSSFPVPAGKTLRLSGGKGRAAVMDKNMVIDPSSYKKKNIEKDPGTRRMLEDAVNSCVLFRHCKKEEKVEILDAFALATFDAGTNVITKGDIGDNFYVVHSGSLDVYLDEANKVEGASLAQGGCFGELALMYDTPRAATVKASSDCKAWFIDRVHFRTIVTVFKMRRTAQYVNFLAKVNFGEKTLAKVLTKNQLEQMAGALEAEVFQPGEHIIRQGQEGDYFYIVEEGEVEVYKTDQAADAEETPKSKTTLALLKAGAYFGEKALLAEDRRQASCVAKTAVKCLTLGRDDFVLMLGNLNDLLTDTEATEKGDSSGKCPVLLTPSTDKTGAKTASAEFSFGNLKVLKTLGCGAFGRVKLVQSTVNNKAYALKCQSKRAIVDNQLQDHVMNERDILLSLNHSFILTLHGAFKDQYAIFFVLELLQGGELFTHLRVHGQLEEKEAKFYGAQVLLAFGHLHAKKIAYRDLKPENLVLETSGYLKVVDFGLAKVVETKTWTLCGTPDYLAPEIILNEGHDKAVDYWALGVLLYEMVAGQPPFYADDPMEVYENILSAKISMPSHFSRSISDLIRKLCKLYQGKRLGNGSKGTAAIQKHKWFNNFDFKGLIQKKLEVPIKPVVKDALDSSNFDDYNPKDEPAPEECPEWDPIIN